VSLSNATISSVPGQAHEPQHSTQHNGTRTERSGLYFSPAVKTDADTFFPDQRREDRTHIDIRYLTNPWPDWDRHREWIEGCLAHVGVLPPSLFFPAPDEFAHAENKACQRNAQENTGENRGVEKIGFDFMPVVKPDLNIFRDKLIRLAV
jgi:hypothetical protein